MGSPKAVKIPVRVLDSRCPVCKGRGLVVEQGCRYLCPRCGGKGRVIIYESG